jgi:hypothetical protein
MGGGGVLYVISGKKSSVSGLGNAHRKLIKMPQYQTD